MVESTPPIVPLVTESPDLLEHGRALALKWGLPLGGCGDEPFVLLLTPERLELRQRGPDAPGPVFVDFIGGAVGHRRRFGGGRGQPIAKAVGMKGGESPSILDATAGLGRDAFVLAGLGSEVRLIERSPVAAALLDNGLERARRDPEVAPIASRMRLEQGDAVSIMRGLGEAERPDVVYLDPMFPPREKSALVKKEMRMFHSVIGGDLDADALLETALSVAKKRVVVKRPDYAPELGQRKATTVIATKKNRFDVYVIKALVKG